MYRIRKHIEIDAGHRVPYHESKCKNLHGHRYRITVEVGARRLVDPSTGASGAGMVMDFGVLKRVLMRIVHDPYDHRMVLWEKDPIVGFIAKYAHYSTEWGIVIVPVIPTAEELSRFWGLQVRQALEDEDELGATQFLSLEVQETPTSMARWEPEESDRISHLQALVELP